MIYRTNEDNGYKNGVTLTAGNIYGVYRFTYVIRTSVRFETWHAYLPAAVALLLPGISVRATVTGAMPSSISRCS
jgi:hypothetical protein